MTRYQFVGNVACEMEVWILVNCTRDEMQMALPPPKTLGKGWSGLYGREGDFTNIGGAVKPKYTVDLVYCNGFPNAHYIWV